MSSKKHFWSNAHLSIIVLAAIALAALSFSPGAVAQEAAVRKMLAFLPEGAQAAIGLPSIEEVEKAAEPLKSHPAMFWIQDVISRLGGDSFSEGLKLAGINVSAPAAVFFERAGTGVNYAAVMVVSDPNKAIETIKSLVSSEASEISLPGDISGSFVAGSNIGWFINGGNLCLASTESLLEKLATRVNAPATIHYGKDMPKDELVVWSRMDIIEASGLLDSNPNLAPLKPAMESFKTFSDEVILAIGEEAGSAYIRLAARDSSGAVESPGPLALHGFMNAQAPAVLNLRITPELVNVMRLSLAANPATRNFAGYLMIVSGLFDDEIALSFNGMKSERVPEAIIAATVKDPASVPNLLKMLLRVEAPSYQHNGKDVYMAPQVAVADGHDIHVAVDGNILVVTPDEAALKGALDSFSGTAAASGIPEAIVNKGVYGFLMLDGSKTQGKNIPAIGPLAGLNLENVSLAMTLGLDGGWRELAISSPKGFAGIANLISAF